MRRTASGRPTPSASLPLLARQQLEQIGWSQSHGCASRGCRHQSPERNWNKIAKTSFLPRKNDDWNGRSSQTRGPVCRTNVHPSLYSNEGKLEKLNSATRKRTI
uniref:Uncharacterized protein n=1 Tax=Ditylenchus dipsaci TaxID=166011 RepID=A0A915CSY7_9BILA